jgi:hypothetical protein
MVQVSLMESLWLRLQAAQRLSKQVSESVTFTYQQHAS